jgi:hypothetical protein
MEILPNVMLTPQGRADMIGALKIDAIVTI